MTADTSTAPAGTRTRWVALLVILGANVLDLVDTTIVNVGAPSIQADIGGGGTAVQWFAGAYILALAIGLVIAGRLGDIFGRRRLFVIGLAGFSIASLACGLAMTPEFLIAARVAQGASGALLLPQGLGMIRAMFSPAELPRAFGLFGSVMGLAAVAGPVIAGLLISADLLGTGWRSIFWVNVPLGIALLIAGLATLPREAPTYPRPRLEPSGLLLIALGTSGVVVALTQGRELGWPVWIFAVLALGVASLVAFGLHARRLERVGRTPLVTPSAFRRRSFTSSLVFGAFYFAAVVGVSLCYALYLQYGRGLEPLLAGLAILPSPIGIAVGSAIAGALAPRLGRRLIQVGILALIAGLAANLVVLIASPEPLIWLLVPGLLVAGIGMGLTFSPFFGIALADLDAREVGSASGTLSAVQQFGSALGVALVATVFFAVVERGPSAVDFGAAMSWALLTALALTLVAGALTFLLPRAASQQDSWSG